MAKTEVFEKPESWQLPYRTVVSITDLASESSQTVFKTTSRWLIPI